MKLKLLFNLGPSDTTQNAVNCGRVNVVLPSQFIRTSPEFVRLTYFSNSTFSEAFPAVTSALISHILEVGLARTRKQMQRIYARRIIATMQDKWIATRTTAVMQFIRKHMCEFLLTVIVDKTVSMVSPCSGPYPAFSGFIYMVPKARNAGLCPRFISTRTGAIFTISPFSLIGTALKLPIAKLAYGWRGTVFHSRRLA